MGMFHCIKCGLSMCDPELYYKKDGERVQGRKTIIICPECDKEQTIQDMINKEILETPNKELSLMGLRLKEKLKLDVGGPHTQGGMG